MQEIAVSATIAEALGLIASGDAGLVSGVGHALVLAATAALLAAVGGTALGAALALSRLPGMRSLGALTAALVALPPGAAVFALAFAATRPPAPVLVAALALSAVPLVATLARRALAESRTEHDETLRALRARPAQALTTHLAESRPRLGAAALLGGLRVLAEAAAALTLAGLLAPRAASGLFPIDLAPAAPAAPMLASGLALAALTAGVAALVLATLVLRDGRTDDTRDGRANAA